MFSAFLNLFQFESLFDPVGVPLGTAGDQLAVFFIVIFGVGFVARVVLRYERFLDPYLKKHIRHIANAILYPSLFLAVYFVIREQRVAYLTSSIVFVVIFLLGCIRLLYLVLYKIGFVYRKERKLFLAKKQYRQYLPKPKK